MAAYRFNKGDNVFVPASRAGLADPPYAVVSRTVLGNEDRSVRIDSTNGRTEKVASSRIFSRIGVLLIRIGDFMTEAELLDPLHESLHQYFYLLMGPERQGIQLRSFDEFDFAWQQSHGTKRYLVLLGHGKKDAILFGRNTWVSPEQIADTLNGAGTEVSVITTACETGHSAFSKTLSSASMVREVIAPQRKVPGAVASQFLQTYFAERLLEGRTEKSSFQQARIRAPGSSNFRRWKSGKLDQ